MKAQALLLGALAVLLAAAVARPATVDPRVLIGEWNGRWITGSGSSDVVQIVVDGFEGDQVRGVLFMTVVIPGQTYYNRDVPFSGAFDGSVLAFGVPPGLWFWLAVSGDHMRGTVQGQQTFGRIELERKR